MCDEDSRLARLRRMAEEQAKIQAPQTGSLSVEEAHKLIHELQVHQIELNIQNEELRRVQLELEVSREHLLQLFHMAPVGYLVLNEVGIILRANDSFCRMVGGESGGVEGKPLADFFEGPDRDIFLARYRAIFKNPSGKSVEARLSRANGGVFHVRIEGTTVSPAPDGRVAQNTRQLLLTMSDITEKKQAEEALREAHRNLDSIIEFLPDSTLVIDRKGTVIAWNKAIEEMTGVPKANILGRGEFEYALPFYGERRQMLINLVLQPNPEFAHEHYDHIQQQEEVLLGEVHAPLAYGGRGAYLWATATVLRDGEGNVVGAIESIRDITRRKKTEAERLELERRLMEARKLESLGVLAGGIAHDFNNLLTIILGNADLVVDDLPPSSPFVPSLLEIGKASHRAAELCNQMLAYAGKGRILIETIDLRRLLQETASLLRSSIPGKIVMNLNLAEELPCMKGDATQIRRIAMNLITNASEAIGERGGIITISTGVVEGATEYLSGMDFGRDCGNERYIRLEVSDTGSGMEKETLSRIFEPFFTTKFTGRGLGLAATMGIVRGHNGALKVESTPGKGTIFKILFPAAEIEVEAVCGGKGTAAKKWRGSGCMLLVDDEENLRTLGKAMLERLGFEAVTAGDGHEAVKVYRERKEQIRFVLLDLTMPGMDGEEAFSELRRIDPGVRIIMASGYSEHELSERFAGKGVDGFVNKPYTLDVLRERIQSLFAGEESGGKRAHSPDAGNLPLFP